MRSEVHCFTLADSTSELPATTEEEAILIRLLASACLHLIANAVGLIMADLILSPEFTIDPTAFVTATLIFTAVEVVAGPLLISISLKNLPALTGGVALVTTFVGLLVTDTLSDGLNISGISTWLLASLIVWLCALIAGVVLPLFLFKKALDARGGRSSG